MEIQAKQQEHGIETRQNRGGNTPVSRVTSQRLINLGNSIRERRQAVHLSQEALAERIGISSNTVSRIEGGQMAMSVIIFQKLVKVLGVDANLLLGAKCLQAEEQEQFQEIICRVQHLEKKEQEIVIQTMFTLIDGLEKRQKRISTDR